MWRRVLSWMYSLCSLKTLSEIIYLPHQLQLKCVEGVSQAEICSLGCISWRTSLLSLQMVSKEACYKGPPFKTRFHELDGCQASGKAKNNARRSVAIASLSSLFWYTPLFKLHSGAQKTHLPASACMLYTSKLRLSESFIQICWGKIEKIAFFHFKKAHF